jgi:hypothetical protein
MSAYEREWELTRKRRIDTLLMEIEREERARRSPRRGARGTQPRPAGRSEDAGREGDRGPARAPRDRDPRPRGALRHLGQAHRDNRAVVQYELARRRIEVGERLIRYAPRPVLVSGDEGESSALSTLLLARILPQLVEDEPRPEEQDGAPG